MSVSALSVYRRIIWKNAENEPYSAVVQFPFQNDGGVYHYGKELTEQMERFLIRQLLEYVPEEKIFRWESWEENSYDTEIYSHRNGCLVWYRTRYQWKLGVLGYEVFGIGRRFDTEEDRDIAGVLQYENDLKMPYFIQSSVTSPIRINCALSWNRSHRSTR